MTLQTAMMSAAFATAGLLAGAVGGRKLQERRVRRLLRGNSGWMSKQELGVVHALLATQHTHVFHTWPPPGTNDAAKRELLAKASSGLSSVAEGLEVQRLAVLSAPVAARKPHAFSLHGDELIDEYYWLRDDKRVDPAVVSHLQAENEYTRAVLADTEALQATLFSEMKGRIQEADTTVPVRHGPWYYYCRTLEGKQYRQWCRCPVPAGAGGPTEVEVMDVSLPETMLLDEDERKAQGHHSFYMLDETEVSPNHQLLAWSEDTVGNERYTIHIKDIATSKELTRPIPGTSGSMVWAADNTHLFYVLVDKIERPYKVMRHQIGQAEPDQVVYEEPDDAFYVSISKSRDDEMIFLHSGSAITSEVRFLRADDPSAPPRMILPRQQDVEYSVRHAHGHFLLLHRDDKRPNSELRRCPVDDTANVQVLLPHRDDVKLEDIAVSAQHVAALERSNGLTHAVVYTLPAADSKAGLGQGTEVVFDEPIYSLDLGASGDFDSPVLRLSYNSLTTPTSIIDVHMPSGRRATKKVAPVLGGFDRSLYTTTRLWASAADGTRVPISLVYRHDLVELGKTPAPTHLYGYGAYEASVDPSFSSRRLSLLDRGWVDAIAHVRGGGEMGRLWYENGKFEKKVNTFTDFIACAEHLFKQNITSPDRLAIQGRSAGGLLIGAVLNLRPDLAAAAIAGVPFVDPVATLLDESIPLTVIEWEEWGNPGTSKEDYQSIKAYDPMINVHAARYPHLLVTSGLHDPRVAYWEPTKWVSKLRATRTNGPETMLVLKMDLGAGHFAQAGRFDALKETALEYAFLIKAVRMSKAGSL